LIIPAGQILPARRVNRVEMACGSEIERLYDEHARLLHAFLLNLTRDRLQDVFVKIDWLT
jgi:hypothetical protein